MLAVVTTHLMLFCDRRDALSLDLRMMESLWSREDCNVGPMVELTSIIQGFIGPDSHKMSASCPTETFRITTKPDAFIVRHGELVGVFIDEERITLRSVLENNRFVMELDPPCPKGSLVDYSAEEDRLTAFDRKLNTVYTYNLRKGICVSLCEVKGLFRGGEEHLVVGCLEEQVLFCFGCKKDLVLYHAPTRAGYSYSQAKQLFSHKTDNERLLTMDMSCRSSDTSISVEIVYGDDHGYGNLSLLFDGIDRPLIRKKECYSFITNVDECHDFAWARLVNHDSFVVRDWNKKKKRSWELVDPAHKAFEPLRIRNNMRVTATGFMPQGVLYIVMEPVDDIEIRLFHRHRRG